MYHNRRLSPRTGRIRGWPFRLRRFSGGINAVFSFNKDQMTYLFKGPKFWRYNDNLTRRFRPWSFPRKITGAWPAVLKNLDAATTWINNKVYVFKGQFYYRLKSDKGVDRRYPQRIATRWMRCHKATQGSMSIGGISSEP